MTKEDNLIRFPFDTGMDNPKYQFSHFTAQGSGNVTTPNAEHNTVTGPATLEMQIWAKTIDQAKGIYLKMSENFGFKPNTDFKVEPSVAMSPSGLNPSAYRLRFTQDDNSSS